MSSILIKDLLKRHGAQVTVDHVSLEVGQSEFIAFLGPSGCGKTTTLRMIAGLTGASAGSIRFGGRDVTHLPLYLRNAGLVFQGYALFPHMRVAENVAFGLQMRKVGREETRSRVDEALSLVKARAPRRAPAEGVVRRPAAACRAGAGHRLQARGAAAGRAALRPRRQAAHRGAHRAEAAPVSLGAHHHLRHPRPGRGAERRRPHRGDVGRPGGAGGHPARDLPAAGDALRRGIHRPHQPVPGGAWKDRAASAARAGSASRSPPRMRRRTRRCWRSVPSMSACCAGPPRRAAQARWRPPSRTWSIATP